MIINYKENGDKIKYPNDLKWVKSFAWLPVRVDDGRIVWLEYIMKITRTRKFPIDYKIIYK